MDLENEPDPVLTLAMMQLLIFFLIVAAVALTGLLVKISFARRQTMRRLDDAITDSLKTARVEASWLTRWLSRAGYRDPAAAFWLFAATAGGVAIGLLAFWLLHLTQAVALMAQSLSGLPGGFGELFIGIVSLAPWFLLCVATAAPVLVVRAARRERIASIERELTITLELLATTAEAGLGFDSALARIQESAPSITPLSEELEIYQRDVLAGVSRLHALRQIAKRIDVNTVTIFVSALAQAEQAGASLAETLRIQANDLRDRRKMQALIQAQSLPVKLVFPLVICFLPGLFFSTLGPALHQLIKVVDGALRPVR